MKFLCKIGLHNWQEAYQKGKVFMSGPQYVCKNCDTGKTNHWSGATLIHRNVKKKEIN